MKYEMKVSYFRTSRKLNQEQKRKTGNYENSLDRQKHFIFLIPYSIFQREIQRIYPYRAPCEDDLLSIRFV